MSWQAWALGSAFRLVLKRRSDKPLNLNLLRASMRNPPKRALRIPKGFTVTPVETEGLAFEVADKAAAPASAPDALVLYLHGGGYFYGSPRTHRQILIGLVKAMGVPVWGLDYRLAPEHPFPAAVEDAVAAYRCLVQKFPAARIVLAGDSAGGGLALVTAAEIRDQGLPAPAGIIAFSPWTDLAATGSSVDANARSCAMFRPAGLRKAADVYLAGQDACDPRASPLYADLAGLPPMLLFASRHELLLDDTLRLAEKAKAAGVDVEVVLRDRLLHVWPIFVHLLPEAREAMQDVTRFAHRIGVSR
ncbi:MAG: alpha/beta hydrolase [Hyphomicrobiales bacterium]|nr:MAG: alpha/beta hydrolase [Hyphomicrobiales bacterium]